jgi:hypothetical protein
MWANPYIFLLGETGKCHVCQSHHIMPSGHESLCQENNYFGVMGLHVNCTKTVCPENNG